MFRPAQDSYTYTYTLHGLYTFYLYAVIKKKKLCKENI